ncbi:MAG TPA: DUF935 family protein [Thermoanaerobaculia bacterium]|nr:DUF935 family protein [Thermoanaerobaculia bacterium]
MASPQTVAVKRLEPWLGREMASEDLAENFFRASAFGPGVFREELHPSPILRERSDWKHRVGELYEEMLRTDADLAAFVDKRVERVTSLPRFIVPADSTPLAEEIARDVQTALSAIPAWGDNIEHQLGGIPRGDAFDEIVWERAERGPLAGAIVPVDILTRPMWRFAFRQGERGQIYIRQRAAEPVPAPPMKFLHFRFRRKDGNWGEPLLDKAYWYWFLKKHGWKYWAVFVERWASPLPIGKYRHDPNNETANLEKQQILLEAIRAFQQEFGATIPDNLAIDLLEAKRSGDASYESFAEACTRGEARVCLGEIDSSGAGKGPGSFAKAESTNEGREEKGRTDAHRGETHISDTLIRWFVWLNWGPDAPAPKLWIAAIDAEDRRLRIEGIDKVLALKKPVPESYLYMTTQVPVPRDGEKVVEHVEPVVELAPENDDDPEAPEIKGAAAGVDAVQNTALNGAQISSLVEIVKGVATGEIPADSAKQACLAAFPSLDDDEVNRLIDPAAAAAAARPTPPPAKAVVVPPPLPPVPPERAAAAAAAAQHARLHLSAEELEEIGAALEGQSADFDTVVESFLPDTFAYYTQHQAEVLRLWDAGDFTAGRGFRRLVDGPEALAHAAAIETAQTHGMGWSLAHLRDDVGLEALKLASPGDFTQARSPETAVEFWSTLLRIPKDVFRELQDANRRLAFTVAGVTDAALLADIHLLVERAIATGMARGEFVSELAEVYERHGVTPTSRHHAELVYSNNVRQAAGVVRWRQTVGNPRIHALIPYLVFWTLGDDRVRARPLHNHRVMHGYIAATGHPIWHTWGCPAGHNCRCLMGTINAPEARRRGLTGAEPVGHWPLADGVQALPDPGFRGVPDLASAASEVEDRAADILDEARRSGSPDLIVALEHLFRSLGVLLGLAGDLDFAALVSNRMAA